MPSQDFDIPDLIIVGPGEPGGGQGKPVKLKISTDGQTYVEDFLQTIVGINFPSGYYLVVHGLWKDTVQGGEDAAPDQGTGGPFPVPGHPAVPPFLNSARASFTIDTPAGAELVFHKKEITPTTTATYSHCTSWDLSDFGFIVDGEADRAKGGDGSGCFHREPAGFITFNTYSEVYVFKCSKPASPIVGNLGDTGTGNDIRLFEMGFAGNLTDLCPVEIEVTLYDATHAVIYPSDLVHPVRKVKKGTSSEPGASFPIGFWSMVVSIQSQTASLGDFRGFNNPRSAFSLIWEQREFSASNPGKTIDEIWVDQPLPRTETDVFGHPVGPIGTYTIEGSSPKNKTIKTDGINFAPWHQPIPFGTPPPELD